MEMIHRHRGSRQPHPQRFPERCRGINCDNVNFQAPFQRALDQPRTNTGVVTAVDNAEDLSGIEVNYARHPRLEAVPGIGVWVFEVAHGTEAVLINAEHPRPQSINVRQLEQAS